MVSWFSWFVTSLPQNPNLTLNCAARGWVASDDPKTRPIDGTARGSVIAAKPGYPTVIVLNPLGQKITDAKYEKGGPGPLLAQMDAVIKKDAERRAMLANQDTTAQ